VKGVVREIACSGCQAGRAVLIEAPEDVEYPCALLLETYLQPVPLCLGQGHRAVQSKHFYERNAVPVFQAWARAIRNATAREGAGDRGNEGTENVASTSVVQPRGLAEASSLGLSYLGPMLVLQRCVESVE
jgi:hypothetical protein